MLVLIRCPTCKGMAQVDNKHLGATVRCPRCKEPFTAVQAGPEPEGPGAAAADAKPEPLANGPTMYLERMHKELGRAEGKALLLKLLGPASTIGWKMVRPLVLPG
jgi:predicted Zn finger-like uncharacterized protein